MSSNSLRLAEAAEYRGVPGKLIQSANDLDPKWLEGVKSISLTSGASTPDDIVQDVIARLKELGVKRIKEFTFAQENARWKLPKNLQDAIKKHDAANKDDGGVVQAADTQAAVVHETAV